MNNTTHADALLKVEIIRMLLLAGMHFVLLDCENRGKSALHEYCDEKKIRHKSSSKITSSI